MDNTRALYHEGDLLALVCSPEQACIVTRNQHFEDTHIQIRRLGDDVDMLVRDADLRVFGEDIDYVSF